MKTNFRLPQKNQLSKAEQNKADIQRKFAFNKIMHTIKLKFKKNG